MSQSKVFYDASVRTDDKIATHTHTQTHARIKVQDSDKEKEKSRSDRENGIHQGQSSIYICMYVCILLPVDG